MTMRVLLAGATGAVGRRVLGDLRARGDYVRTLSRDPRRAKALVADDVRVLDVASVPPDAPALTSAMDGVDVVVSCLGANVSLRAYERRSYADVDTRANLALVAAATAARVPRFVYPDDVARACVDAVASGPPELEIGGPEILTRRRIVELAFESLGERPRIVHVPLALPRLQSVLLRPLHPRLSELLEFVAAVMSTDCVAEPRGTTTLAQYFASLTRARALSA